MIREINLNPAYGDAYMDECGLPPALLKTAELRLEYPDVSIQELGTYLDPPVGKSGVNHRLRRLSQIAEEIREENGKAASAEI